jgi:hypothetical protein
MKLFQKLFPSRFPTKNWCLIGNGGGLRDRGEGTGTKHFSQGTKVYCLPAAWGDGYERVIVVGLHRDSKKLVTLIMSVRDISNWRVTEIHQQEVLRRLSEGYKEFRPQWKSRAEVDEYVRQLSRGD